MAASLLANITSTHTAGNRHLQELAAFIAPTITEALNTTGVRTASLYCTLGTPHPCHPSFNAYRNAYPNVPSYVISNAYPNVHYNVICNAYLNVHFNVPLTYTCVCSFESSHWIITCPVLTLAPPTITHPSFRCTQEPPVPPLESQAAAEPTTGVNQPAASTHASTDDGTAAATAPGSGGSGVSGVEDCERAAGMGADVDTLPPKKPYIKVGAQMDAIFEAEVGASRVEKAAADIAAAMRLAKVAEEQREAARLAKQAADVDAAGDLKVSDDDFEEEDVPGMQSLALQKEYLWGAPKPELKRLATHAGLNLKGNAKKPAYVKALLAHYANLRAKVPCP